MIVWMIISVDEDEGHEVGDRTKEDIIEDEWDSEEEGGPNQRLKGNYFRKQLICERLVNRIDNSLHEKKT